MTGAGTDGSPCRLTPQAQRKTTDGSPVMTGCWLGRRRPSGRTTRRSGPSPAAGIFRNPGRRFPP